MLESKQVVTVVFRCSALCCYAVSGFRYSCLAMAVLLDLTAAFDTVDHDLMMLKLERQFGLRGVVLDWFRSYLCGRTYRVFHGGAPISLATSSAVTVDQLLRVLVSRQRTSYDGVVAVEARTTSTSLVLATFKFYQHYQLQ